MLTDELMTFTLICLNVLFFTWMFVIGVYHYFLHKEQTLARNLRKKVESTLEELEQAQKYARAAEELEQAQKYARAAEEVAMLRCKLKCDNQ